MAIPQIVTSIFRAGGGLASLLGRGALASASNLRRVSDSFNEISEASDRARYSVGKMIESTVGAQKRLEDAARQSAVTISAQVNIFNTLGNSVDDVGLKVGLFQDKFTTMQKQLEQDVKNIVGATSQLTNSVLQNVTLQFSEISGQSKKYLDDIDLIQKLTKNLTTASATFGLTPNLIPQEIRALLMGDINNPDALLARRLRDSFGFTKEVYNQAKATGQLGDKILEVTDKISEANAVGVKSLQNSLSNVQDEFNIFFKSIGEGSIRDIENGFQNLFTVFNKLNENQELSKFGNQIGEAFGESAKVLLNEFGIVLERMAENGSLEAIGSNIVNIAEAIGKTIEILGIGAAKIAEFFGQLAKVGEAATNLSDKFFKATTDLFDSTWGRMAEEGTKAFKSIEEFVVGRSAPEITVEIKFDKGKVEQDLKDLLADAAGNSNVDLDFLAQNAKAVAEATKQYNISDKVKFDYSGTLEENQRKVADAIRSSGVNEATQESTLNTIANAKSISELSKQLSGLDKELQRGATGGVSDKFFAQLDALNAQRQALKQQIAQDEQDLDFLSQKGASSDREKEQLKILKERIEQAKELKDTLDVNAKTLAEQVDPAIMAQKNSLAELQAERDALQAKPIKTEEDIQNLKNLDAQILESRKEISNLIESYDGLEYARIKTLTLPETTLKAQENFGDQVRAIVEGSAKDMVVATQSLLKSVDEGVAVGILETEEGVQALRNVMNSGYLDINEKIQVYSKANALIDDGVAASAKGIEVEKTKLDILNAQGLKRRDDVAEEKAKFDTQEANLRYKAALERKANFEALQSTTDLKQLIVEINSIESEQLQLKQDGLTSEEKITYEKLESEKAEKATLKAALENSSATEDKLNTEVELAKAKLEVSKQAEKQLEFENKIAYISERRAKFEAELAVSVASANNTYQTWLENGEISLAYFNKVTQSTSLQVAEKTAELTRIALEQQRNLLAQASDLSPEAKLQQYMSVLAAEEEHLNALNSLSQERIKTEQAAIQYQIDRREIANEILQSEYDLSEAQNKVAQDYINIINDRAKALQDFQSAVADIQNQLDSLKIVELELKITGIERLRDLQDKLDNAKDTELRAVLSDSIDETEEIFGLAPTEPDVETTNAAQLENAQQMLAIEQELNSIKESSAEADMARAEELRSRLDSLKAYQDELIASQSGFQLESSGSSLYEQEIAAIEQIGALKEQQILREQEMANARLAIERDIEVASINATNIELEAANNLLQIKHSELEIEKQKIALRVASGELSEQEGAQLKRNISSTQDLLRDNATANEQTIEANIQRKTQQEELYNKQVELNNATAENAIKQNEIETATKLQDANIANAANNTGVMADNADRAADNFNRAANNSSRVGSGSGGGGSDGGEGGGNPYKDGTERDGYYYSKSGTRRQAIPGKEAERAAAARRGSEDTSSGSRSGGRSEGRSGGSYIQESGEYYELELTQRSKDTIASGMRQRAGARPMNPDELKYYRSLGMRPSGRTYGLEQQLVRKSISSQGSSGSTKTYTDGTLAATRASNRESTISADEILNSRAQIAKLLAEMRTLSLSPQTKQTTDKIAAISKQIDELIKVSEDNPQVLDLQKRLAELNTKERTPEVALEMAALAEQIRVLTEGNRSSDSTTLLEALKSGQFQAGAFKPGFDGSLMIDPTTGQLIVSGTRPDLEQINLLIEANDLAKQGLNLMNLQLDATKSISTGGGEGNQLLEDVTGTINDLGFQNNLAQLTRSNDDSYLVGELKRSGVLSDGEASMLSFRAWWERTGNRYSGDAGIQAAQLHQSGLIDADTYNKYALKDGISKASSEEAKRQLLLTAGYNSYEQFQQDISALPNVMDVVHSTLNIAAQMPSPKDIASSLQQYKLALGQVGQNIRVEDLLNYDDQVRQFSAALPGLNPLSGSTNTNVVPNSSGIVLGTNESYSTVTSTGSRIIGDGGQIIQNTTNNYYPSSTGSIASSSALAGI